MSILLHKPHYVRCFCFELASPEIPSVTMRSLILQKYEGLCGKAETSYLPLYGVRLGTEDKLLILREVWLSTEQAVI